MKIRPKTFECALELVRRGWVLYKKGVKYQATWVGSRSVVWRFDEWMEDGYCWDSDNTRYPNTKAWQNDPNWYFKK